MKYNTAIRTEKAEAFRAFMRLANQKKIIEIKKISPTRSLRQNAYLHLLIGYFGVHFGYTLEEAKLIYKEINSSTYRYEKKGRVFWKSSADLTVDEMTKSIEVFRERSDREGCYLPAATDTNLIMYMENEIEKAKQYL